MEQGQPMNAVDPLIDLIFRLHFYGPILQVQPFDVAAAGLLVAVAAAIGFILGVTPAPIWNGLHRDPRPSAR